MKYNRCISFFDWGTVMGNRDFIDELVKNGDASDEVLFELIEDCDREYLFGCADRIRREYYGTDVYIRGLIELTNYCKNNCFYCGIRRDNSKAQRYRLNEEDVLECCREGYELGFRTFVMQGGEDLYYNDDRMCSIITKIKSKYPDCAVTLSLGERSYQSYKRMFDSGADRYLLRHETAINEHYSKLHPANMHLEERKECLFNLKEIGYQVGSGFMVGSPFQTTDNLVADLRFLKELEPAMIGIGPFIVHRDTPFKEYSSGTMEKTLVMVALARIMFPYALIPSTTALGTINPMGREKGIMSGANVVMPNLSPVSVRSKYELYNNKLCTGSEAAEALEDLRKRMEAIGYSIVVSRGDVKERKSK